MGQADVAMYRAKVKGKDTYEVFEPGMQDVVAAPSRGAHRPRARHRSQRARRDVPADRRHHHSTPVGVEALVRWKHPRWGMVAPLEFIGIAEETGMIRELGLYVLEEACRQWQEWQVELIDEPPSR